MAFRRVETIRLRATLYLEERCQPQPADDGGVRGCRAAAARRSLARDEVIRLQPSEDEVGLFVLMAAARRLAIAQRNRARRDRRTRWEARRAFGQRFANGCRPRSDRRSATTSPPCFSSFATLLRVRSLGL